MINSFEKLLTNWNNFITLNFLRFYVPMVHNFIIKRLSSYIKVLLCNEQKSNRISLLTGPIIRFARQTSFTKESKVQLVIYKTNKPTINHTLEDKD